MLMLGLRASVASFGILGIDEDPMDVLPSAHLTSVILAIRSAADRFKAP